MKNINQIFKNDLPLLDKRPVKELVEYCKSLEDEIISSQQTKTYNKEAILKDIVFNIKNSIKLTIQSDDENTRFNLNDPIDYKLCIRNLEIYIDDMVKLHRLRL